MVITSTTFYMAITSAKAYHLPIQHCGNTSALKICFKKQSVKILQDTTFSHTPSGVSKLYRTTFSSDLRKPCCKLGKTCLQIQIIVLFLRKVIIISYKQNEKHPFTNTDV